MILSGDSVIAVGITNVVDEELLKMISSPPQQEGKQYFRAPDFRELDQILEQLTAGTCEETKPPSMIFFRMRDFLYFLSSLSRGCQNTNLTPNWCIWSSVS